MAMKTTNQYIEELKIKNPNITVVGEYTGNHKKIDVKCKICGTSFSSDAASLLQGHGCKICGHNNAKIKQRRKHDEFVALLKDINPDLEVISPYDGSKSKIKVRCLKCCHEYESYPSNLLHGYGCMQCYKQGRFRTKEELIADVFKLNKNITVQDDYVNGKTHCSFKCNKCGYVIRILPNNFLSKGCECPKCNGNIKMSPDEYCDFISSVSDVVVLGKYENVKLPIEYGCCKCNKTWTEMPEVFAARNYTCKYCETVRSRLELKIRRFLEDRHIDFQEQKKFDGLLGVGGRSLSFDFFIPSMNVLIEAQGKQHFTPISFFGGDEMYQKQVEHDRRKKEYARNNNYKFVEIYYNEAKQIESVLGELF